jgi:hypothetical protein
VELHPQAAPQSHTQDNKAGTGMSEGVAGVGTRGTAKTIKKKIAKAKKKILFASHFFFFFFFFSPLPR